MTELIITYTLVNGGVYALLAIGFCLIFGVARLINLAHTAFFMLGAYGVFFFIRRIGLGYPETIALTLVIVTLLGMLAYRFIIDRLREHHAAVLLVTIALAIIIENILLWLFQGETHGVQELIGGYMYLGGIKVANQNILVLGIAAAAIIAVQLLLTKTKMGTAIRATAQDAEIANLMGISVSRILLITMGIATLLAAIGGILLAPTRGVNPGMWGDPMVITMVIVVLGGLGSVKGSIIGAFIIALVEQLSTFMLPEGGYLIDTFVLLTMVIVLIVRPGGLFGIVLEEERL